MHSWQWAPKPPILWKNSLLYIAYQPPIFLKILPKLPSTSTLFVAFFLWLNVQQQGKKTKNFPNKNQRKKTFPKNVIAKWKRGYIIRKNFWNLFQSMVKRIQKNWLLVNWNRLLMSLEFLLKVWFQIKSVVLLDIC